ncbi:hypothetical protein [Arthrobacter sp. TE12232]
MVDKLMPAQGVGRHTSGGKKLHNDVIFPDFSASPSKDMRRTAASAPAAPRVHSLDTPDQPSPEPANQLSPDADAPVGGRTAGPGSASGPPAASRTRKGRLAAPPFSWLGGDAWPHFPAWADTQV